MATTLTRVAGQESGDILAFLPGAGEIRQVENMLTDWAAENRLLLRPLYGDLSRTRQQEAIQPDRRGRRRLVLSTDIAESSLTIEGVRIVVDAGWQRRARFDPNSGLDRLVTERVSRAGADQRAGRAGRLGPGICYRLWPVSLDRQLPPHRRPEILDADLAPVVLELAAWGITDPHDLFWFDPPPGGHYAQGREILFRLGAVDRQGMITPFGKQLVRLPLHPRLAAMLASTKESGGRRQACDLAALLAERDILESPGGPRPADLELRLRMLSACRKKDTDTLRGLQADPGACRRILRASGQWCRRLAGGSGRGKISAGDLLAIAYPDRVAQLRPGSRNRYRLAGGRGACLPPEDSLCGSPYLVAASLDAGRSEGRIFLAAPVTEEELRRRLGGQLTSTTTIAWDTEAEMVVCRRETRLGELVLTSRPLEHPDPEEVNRALVTGLRRKGPGALPWTDKARRLQARILSLRCWEPQAGWPDIRDETLMATLGDWLPPYLNGTTRQLQLNRLDLAAVFHDMLDHRQRKRLAEEAPAQLRVPSGSKRCLEYEPGKPPVLAVGIQEMFGLASTPRICHGKISVLLHLLSPAGRPIQITDDLAGFWNHTYREVKKELKGRYPKHHWPDDPWRTTPTAGVKKRR